MIIQSSTFCLFFKIVKFNLILITVKEIRHETISEQENLDFELLPLQSGNVAVPTEKEKATLGKIKKIQTDEVTTNTKFQRSQL